MIAAGVVSHCHFWFHRVAMDIYYRIGDWGRVDDHATALQDYTKGESLPWTDYFITRGRALAVYGRGERDETNMAEIARLNAVAEAARLTTARPLLEEILNG